MNKILLNYFNNFKIPENYSNSICAICMEDFLESEKRFIRLPCECSNSFYHIECIIRWINSGNRKNFCVHCKRYFEIPNISNLHEDNSIEIINLTNSQGQVDVSNRQGFTRQIYAIEPIQITVLTQVLINNSSNDFNQLDELDQRINNSLRSNPNGTSNAINQNDQNFANTLTNEEILQRINLQKDYIKTEYAYLKFILHIILNNILNLINFCYICAIKTNSNLIMLGFIFISKIFINFLLIDKIIKNVNSLNIKLYLSLIIQFIIMVIIFIFITGKDIRHPIIFYTHVILFGIDIIISRIMSYYCNDKVKNAIYNS